MAIDVRWGRGWVKTLVDDLGIWAICTCSLHLPSGFACSWSQMCEPSYDGLLLGPPKLMIWWVWHHRVHDEQLRTHSHLMFHGQRIIPNKFIQSHLSVILLLANAIFCFLVLHYVCDYSSKHSHHLNKCASLGLIHLLKHTGRGHDLFPFAFPEMIYNVIHTALKTKVMICFPKVSF